MKACCKRTTAKQRNQHQMQPTGKLPLTSDSPSQSVSALPQNGSVEGEVQLLVSSHAGAGRPRDHNGEEATPNASERKAAIDDTGPLTSDSPWTIGFSTAAERLSGRRSTIAGVIPCWGRKPLMKACCARTTTKEQKQQQMQPTGQLPLRSKLLDNTGPQQTAIDFSTVSSYVGCARGSCFALQH